MTKFSINMLAEFNDFLVYKNVRIPNFEKVDLDEDIPLYGKDAEQFMQKLDELVSSGREYPTANRFCDAVIEIMEDTLNEHGIVLDNYEKIEALLDGRIEELSDIGNVYGTDYAMLKTAIRYAADDCLPERYAHLFEVRDLEFEESYKEIECGSYDDREW